jgi:hypothetical protein
MSEQDQNRGQSWSPFELFLQLIDPTNWLRGHLLDSARVARMASEMQTYYLERVRSLRDRAADIPSELQELASRVVRLKGRLKCGDPDMTADEVQAAIDRAEEKRRALENNLPETGQSSKPRIQCRSSTEYRCIAYLIGCIASC